MTSPKQIKKRISAVFRRERVLILKRQGLSNRAIAIQLETEGTKVSHAQVGEDWKTALRERMEDTKGYADEVRELELARYERLYQSWFPLATGYTEDVTDEGGTVRRVTHPPDERATRICQNIIFQERKMLGLDDELGTEKRPITYRDLTEKSYDFTEFTTQDLATLHALHEAAEIVKGNGLDERGDGDRT